MGICKTKQNSLKDIDIESIIHEINKNPNNKCLKIIQQGWEKLTFQVYIQWMEQILNCESLKKQKKSFLQIQKKKIKEHFTTYLQYKSQKAKSMASSFIKQSMEQQNKRVDTSGIGIPYFQQNHEQTESINQILKIQVVIESLKQNIEDLKNQLKQKDNQIVILQKKIQELENHINRSSILKQETSQEKQNDNESENSKRKYSNSFWKNFKEFSDSKVLHESKQQLSYERGKRYRQIIDEIFQPLAINESNLKFTYDKVRPNNMFEYIENQKNLLLLAKLQNGTIIGGFSSLGFKEKQEKLADNRCFIFSIHQNMDYYKFVMNDQKKAKYSVKLDKDYLKIGANEIRITCCTNQGYSNFNSNTSIFVCNNKQVGLNQFLNITDGKDLYQLETYEIHELQVTLPTQSKENSNSDQKLAANDSYCN